MDTKFFSNNGRKFIQGSDIPEQAGAVAYKIMKSGDVLISFRATDRAAKMAYNRTMKEDFGQYTSYGWSTIDNNDRKYGMVL